MKKKYLIIILFLIIFLTLVNNKVMLKLDSSSYLTRGIYLKESLKQGYYPTIYPYNALSIPEFKLYPPIPTLMLGFGFFILDGINELLIMKYLSLIMILFQALSLYYLAKTIFGDENKAVLSAILLLILPSNWLLITLFVRIRATYAVPFILLFLAEYIKYLRKPSRKNLAFSAILLMLSLLTHPIIASQFLILAVFYSILFFKKHGFKTLTPLIIGFGLCSFYTIPLINLQSIFSSYFNVFINRLALFLPLFNDYVVDRTTYMSPLIFFGGIIGAWLILKNRDRKKYPLLAWFSYVLMVVLLPEIFGYAAKMLSWAVYMQLIGIACCIVFPTLLSKNEKTNKVVYALIILFLVLNVSYIIGNNGMVADNDSKISRISQFFTGQSYDNNLLALPRLPSSRLIPFYLKTNNVDRSQSWAGINSNYLSQISLFNNNGLRTEQFYPLVKELGVHTIILEKKGYGEDWGFYNEWFRNNTLNYIMIINELLDEYPDEFTLLYEDENMTIIRTGWNNSFVTGGTYKIIRPEKIRIFPENNTVFVKLCYYNNWVVSNGTISETRQGLIKIETNNNQPILLEFLPNNYDYAGLLLTLITLVYFMISVKKLK